MLQSFGISSDFNMRICVESYAAKFNFANNKCRKLNFENHVMGYQMVLVGCDVGSDKT